jgi:hypothetical protein
MDTEHAVKHLSQSHMYCWRTLAVTLELFPALYRNAMFQLALVPPGALVSEPLLRELWALGEGDMPGVVSMFTAISMLVPLPGPAGTQARLRAALRIFVCIKVSMTVATELHWCQDGTAYEVRACMPRVVCLVHGYQKM